MPPPSRRARNHSICKMSATALAAKDCKQARQVPKQNNITTGEFRLCQVYCRSRPGVPPGRGQVSEK
jgi:hypothetical protein